MLDENAVAEAIFSHVETYVERATAPLLRRLDDLEGQAQALRLERDEAVIRAAGLVDDITGLRAEWEAKFAALEAGANSAIEASHVDEQTSALRVEIAELRALVDAIPEPQPVEIPDVQRLVDEAVAALPPAQDGQPGKDAEPVDYERVIAAVVSQIPAPQDGKGVTVEDVAPLIAEAVQRAVDALPAAKDGVGLAGAIINRDHHLIVTMTDGSTHDLGEVVGRDGEKGDPGKDGRDGFSLEDFDSEIRDGGRTLILSFTAGDVRHTVEHQLDVVLDRGVYKAGETYQPGDGATWGGSWWIAQAQTKAKPGENNEWRLAAKKGQNGKDIDLAAVNAMVEASMHKAEERLAKIIEAGLKRRDG